MISFDIVIPQIVPFDFGSSQINNDDMVSTMCVSNKGDLPIDIYWTVVDDYGNERRILTNDGVVISRSNQRLSVLTIESVKGRHRGNYTCHVKNIAGSAHYSAQLAINGVFYIQYYYSSLSIPLHFLQLS